MVENANRLLVDHFSWVTTWWKRIFVLVALVHGLAFLGSGGTEIRLAPITIIVFAGAMAWIGPADAQWRKELLFLQSLGISPGAIAGFWVISVILLEIVLSVVNLALF